MPTRWRTRRAIRSFEAGRRMQRVAPQLLSLSSESQSMRALYGIDQPRPTISEGNVCWPADYAKRGFATCRSRMADNTPIRVGSALELAEACGSCPGVDLPIAGCSPTSNSGSARRHDRLVGGRVWTDSLCRKERHRRDHNPTGFTVCCGGRLSTGCRHGRPMSWSSGR